MIPANLYEFENICLWNIIGASECHIGDFLDRSVNLFIKVPWTKRKLPTTTTTKKLWK